MKIEMEKAYMVTTEGDCEGKSTRTLGYATGEEEDIKKYFDSRKYYKIFLHEIDIMEITPEAVDYKNRLLDKKRKLESDLGETDEELNKMGLSKKR